MSHLANKKILLAVTGSIAAYKAAELIRLLRTQGAEVKVVMTEDACEFITELTLQALSGQPVYKALLDPQSEASMSHITLAKWADLLLVAPATANVLAKFAQGLADDLLSTLYLACSSQVAIVPAMNQQMWRHPATVHNTKLLMERGVMLWGPESGEQACGDLGPGRLLAPSEIVNRVVQFFAPKCLMGIKIVITAGPTREAIDPVRYISNYSSGKMGYALAKVANDLGGKVLLISGPTQLPAPTGVNTIVVRSACEMHKAVMANIADCQIFIGCAAVADYRSVQIFEHKLKKELTLNLQLEKNPDILLAVSQLQKRPFVVGFAAETEHLIEHAREKLQGKSMDMIIANQVGSGDSGFESDYNQVSVLTLRDHYDLPLATKYQLANKLIALIWQAYERKIS
jgi:phosphopantothenoylcysteine decarboxylase / phosphopantothenate---cysteine ligase